MMERLKKDHCALLVWNVPKELREQFKQACRDKGRTMQDVVIELLHEYIND
jgi:hypothetical protein